MDIPGWKTGEALNLSSLEHGLDKRNGIEIHPYNVVVCHIKIYVQNLDYSRWMWANKLQELWILWLQFSWVIS